MNVLPTSTAGIVEVGVQLIGMQASSDTGSVAATAYWVGGSIMPKTSHDVTRLVRSQSKNRAVIPAGFHVKSFVADATLKMTMIK
jgi:hypothetical protein